MAEGSEYGLEASGPEVAATPSSLKQLRACKTCRLIKTTKQFLEDACENCLHERPVGSRHADRDEYVQTKTTPAFSG
jgi:hypothetical protein